MMPGGEAMRLHIRDICPIGMLVAIILGLHPLNGLAQATRTAAPPAAAAIPRLADGTPDLNGDLGASLRA